MIAVLLLGFAFAFIDWYAVASRRRRLEYVAKPATLALLVVWYTLSLPRPVPAFGLWFAVGLGLSLVGDIFLMLPGDRFIQGLVSFLLAHVAYIVAFNIRGPLLSLGSLVIAAAVGLIAAIILRRLRQGLRASGHTALFGPLVAYGIVLGLTLWSTLTVNWRPDWPRPAASLVTLGGALFFVSDACLACNRFVGPLPGERLLVMVTYHLAQFSLAAGVLMAVGGL